MPFSGAGNIILVRVDIRLMDGPGRIQAAPSLMFMVRVIATIPLKFALVNSKRG